MLLAKFFAFSTMCFSVLPALAAPTTLFERSTPQTATPEEVQAFTHFQQKLNEAFTSLSKAEQNIISRRSKDLLTTVESKQTTESKLQPRIPHATVNLIWLMEAVGGEIIAEAISQGLIKAHDVQASSETVTNSAVKAAKGAAEEASGAAKAVAQSSAHSSGGIGKLGGYGLAFGLGIVAFAILAGKVGFSTEAVTITNGPDHQAHPAPGNVKPCCGHAKRELD
ncbi:hypothetical protein FRB99_004003 [Tulasnella sp. 403]|nr:hypothetical protein FRB99_004003 [Tulasnella sp. 403]